MEQLIWDFINEALESKNINNIRKLSFVESKPRQTKL